MELNFKSLQQVQRQAMVIGFKTLLEIEAEVQLATGDPRILEPSPDKIRTFFLALHTELSEVLQETHWKPWKKAFEPSAPRIIGEWADVLAFLALDWLYLLRITGCTVEQFVDAFIQKSETNTKRLSGEVKGYGYDGSLSEERIAHG